VNDAGPTAVAVELVDDCVAYVQFGAFTGNPLLLGMWNEANQDVSTLRNNCDALGRTNLVGLEGMSTQWAAVEAFTSAAQAQTTNPPMTQPAPALDAPPTPPTKTPIVEPEPASACDPNYSGCVPIASDVDCSGGTGNGPAYVDGPLDVIGTDIYGLDKNHDGVACEHS
jgi:hypothetical protein